ncbi:uridine nucleosidase [Lentinula raphanica]|nr:uridine nucleosidase [Lentinula raphanica]
MQRGSSLSMNESLKTVWLDVDPGHDDATTIMLALNLPNIHLLGISTVHGNASSHHTALNAARCLFAFGGGALNQNVSVYPGASHPLILPTKHDPEIHGPDGLGGVEGLPSADEPSVEAFIARDEKGVIVRALEGMADQIKRFRDQRSSEEKVTIVSCGPMTNLALFVSVYPEMLEIVEQIVFMGGGVGLGNRSAVAEFNILCDPHAAQIVLDAPVPTVMIPLNVTHTAIFTREIQLGLLRPENPHSTDRTEQLSANSTSSSLPHAATPLRHTLSTLITFFSSTYVSTFGPQFASGPPLHDALTIAYVACPELFSEKKRHRVDVELSGMYTRGETVVDLYGYRDDEWKNYDDDDGRSWGREGKNCIVVQALNVNTFFDMFLACVARCDAVSPLNKQTHCST